MTFQQLGLMEPILRALADMGYEKPSPIQKKAISPALAGRDVLGCAQTGTGKTCAFAAPILQRLQGQMPPGRPIRSLILTPTRELALQIQESFAAYGKYLPLRCAVIFGGVGQQPQVDKLKAGVDILVATPGRLLDLQGQGYIDLSRLEIFVLDEADRMLDMGFIHDVRRVLKLLPAKKQTLFFSATMPPEVMELVNALLRNPVKVAVDPISSPVEVIDQSLYLVDKGNKTKLLAMLIEKLGVKNALVFTRTKHGANKVAADLQKAGITAAAIHGNKSQTARQQALGDFKAGKIQCLVATDIAARGLDIEELSHVFNYNLPEVPETYVHRIGRTGRAGRGGAAVSFCDFAELEYLKGIEKLIGKPVPRVEGHPWPMQVLEAPKDAKGRVVNADDAEARAAARERKAQRSAQSSRQRSAAAEKKAPSGQTPAPENRAPAVPTPAKAGGKRDRPRPQGSEEKGRVPSKRGVRHQNLRDTLPAAPQVPSGDFFRPDPLAGDAIMDATARLLAPKPRTVLPSQPSRRREEPRRQADGRRGSSPRPDKGQEAKPRSGKGQEAKPRPEGERPSSRAGKGRTAPAARSTPPQERRRSGGRGRPGEIILRTGNQKDSTEQPSLMKPYYLSPDD